MPELDDTLDEVAANQRAIALLQNIRSNDPDLWQTVTDLPDGIRSALTCSRGSDLDDAPQPGETIVMMAASDAVRCYAVADDLVPRPIGTGQFVTAAECEPDAPTLPLPENTNARVNAASEAFRNDISRLLGSMRRRTPGNLRNRNFIKRQINGIGTTLPNHGGSTPYVKPSPATCPPSSKRTVRSAPAQPGRPRAGAALGTAAGTLPTESGCTKHRPHDIGANSNRPALTACCKEPTPRDPHSPNAKTTFVTPLSSAELL